MAYIKFKELAKYFDFKTEVNEESLQDYAKEYIDNDKERFVFAYKNSKDYIVFTDKRMILFDRDTLAVYYKKFILFLINQSHQVQLIINLVK